MTICGSVAYTLKKEIVGIDQELTVIRLLMLAKLRTKSGIVSALCILVRWSPDIKKKKNFLRDIHHIKYFECSAKTKI